MRSPTPSTTIRELDWRSSDGIDVRLLWNSVTDEIVVTVHDTRSGRGARGVGGSRAR